MYACAGRMRVRLPDHPMACRRRGSRWRDGIAVDGPRCWCWSSPTRASCRFADDRRAPASVRAHRSTMLRRLCSRPRVMAKTDEASLISSAWPPPRDDSIDQQGSAPQVMVSTRNLTPDFPGLMVHHAVSRDDSCWHHLRDDTIQTGWAAQMQSSSPTAEVERQCTFQECPPERDFRRNPQHRPYRD